MCSPPGPPFAPFLLLTAHGQDMAVQEEELPEHKEPGKKPRSQTMEILTTQQLLGLRHSKFHYIFHLPHRSITASLTPQLSISKIDNRNAQNLFWALISPVKC